MSYDNHDQGDPNKAKYTKNTDSPDGDFQTGAIIKIFGMAINMSLKEFKEYMEKNYIVTKVDK